MNPKVDFYFSKAKKWEKELEQLRMIVLDCGLTEELKWGVPCYTFQKSNIVLIHVFKEYCALLFFKGITGNSPLQFFAEPTIKNDHSQLLQFFLPLFGFTKIKINLRIHCIYFLVC